MLTAFQDQVRETSDLRQALVEKDQALKEKDRLIAGITSRLSRT